MDTQRISLARELRAKGLSYGEIAKELGVSKGSVRNWTRDIVLTNEQKEHILLRKYGPSTVDKRRITRAKNREYRVKWLSNEAKSEISRINPRDLKMLGLAMYWSEGAKTLKNTVQFSDTDPIKIKLMMRFFREVCRVPQGKFRGYISIDPHLDAEDAKIYWAGVMGISTEQIYKPYQSFALSRQHIEKIPKYGVLAIIINDVQLVIKICAWLEKIKELSAFSPIRQPIAE